MHELSLARDIIETVYQNVPKEEVSRVSSVVIKVGTFSGVVTDSLKFSFQAITSGTELEGAELETIEIPFMLKCNDCSKETTNEIGMMLCSDCGSGNTEIISGGELQIVEVKIQEAEEAA